VRGSSRDGRTVGASARRIAPSDAATALIGARIVSVHETAETVSGPARLAKIMLDTGTDTDEITVPWGLRRTGRPL
jgi:hypothetical protein